MLLAFYVDFDTLNLGKCDRNNLDEIMRRKIFFLISVPFFVALFFSSCQIQISPISTPIKPKLESKNPQVRGVIREIFKNEGRITGVFIVGEKETDTNYDKAIVGITEKTVIYSKLNSNYIIISPEDLFIGENAAILFVGPIGESNPVQAYADEIVVTP